VPVSKEISYIYYNKELFERAGVAAPETAFASWEDFFAACEKFKAAGIIPLGMDTADSGWLSNLWFCALIATQSEQGRQWMNSEFPTDFSKPEIVAAAEQLQKMLAEYTTADAVGGKYDPMATHFFNGEVAMFPNGPWMIPDFRSPDKAAADFYDKVGVMLMPRHGMSMVPTPGDMVGATDPAKIKAAVAFLKYSTTIENQLKALEMTGLQPVSPQVEIPASLAQTDPLMATVLDVASRAQVTYGQNQAYWHQNVIDAFSTYLPELAYRNMNAAQFCAKLGEAAAKN
jgi:raffinose/stachyose/melibiose transport system substrate-binding protein